MKKLLLPILCFLFLSFASAQARVAMIVGGVGGVGGGSAAFCDGTSADFCSDWDGAATPTDGGVWDSETDGDGDLNVVSDQMQAVVDDTNNAYVRSAAVIDDNAHIWIYFEVTFDKAKSGVAGSWDSMTFMRVYLNGVYNVRLRWGEDNDPSDANLQYLYLNNTANGVDIDPDGVVEIGYKYKVRIEYIDTATTNGDTIRCATYANDAWGTRLDISTAEIDADLQGFDEVGLGIYAEGSLPDWYPLTIKYDNFELYDSNPGWTW